MITIENVYNAVATQLSNKFKIDINSRNTSEGFDAECFFLEIVEPKVSMVTSDFQEEDFYIRITFFPKTGRELVRNLEVKNILQQMFCKNIRINSSFIAPITEQSFTFTTNGDLEMLIGVEMVQDISVENGELMKDIEIR